MYSVGAGVHQCRCTVQSNSKRRILELQCLSVHAFMYIIQILHSDLPSPCICIGMPLHDMHRRGCGLRRWQIAHRSVALWLVEVRGDRMDHSGFIECLISSTTVLVQVILNSVLTLVTHWVNLECVLRQFEWRNSTGKLIQLKLQQFPKRILSVLWQWESKGFATPVYIAASPETKNPTVCHWE